MAKDSSDSEKSSGLSGFQRATLVLLVLILVASVAGRALLAKDGTGVPGAGAGPGLGFSPSASPGSSASGQAPGFDFQDLLPFATEGSFFALIGFALGYTTRKVFKVLLIVIALAFVIVQALAYAEVIQVDWALIENRFNEFVLNLQRQQTVSKVLSYRLPSLGALGLGWVIGLRRG